MFAMDATLGMQRSGLLSGTRPFDQATPSETRRFVRDFYEVLRRRLVAALQTSWEAPSTYSHILAQACGLFRNGRDTQSGEQPKEVDSSEPLAQQLARVVDASETDQPQIQKASRAFSVVRGLGACSHLDPTKILASLLAPMHSLHH